MNLQSDYISKNKKYNSGNDIIEDIGIINTSNIRIITIINNTLNKKYTIKI